MAITYNGTNISSIEYDDNHVSSVSYDGTTVYTESGSVLILESASLETDISVVPPPYDENGYNYNDQAPKKTNTLSIPLGDITSYNCISFEWNNDGTYNAYGIVKGTVTINETTTELFDTINESKKTYIDVSDLSGEYSLRFYVEATSKSSYRGYVSKTALSIKNIYGVYESIQPEDNSFVVDSGTSVVPPPYDENGYNYSSIAPEKEEQHIFDLGNVTSKTTFTFDWSNYKDDEHSLNGYGQIYAKYVDLNGLDVYLFNKSLSEEEDLSGSVTIDLTNFTGNKSIIFKVYAKSESSYRGNSSRSMIYISNISVT